MTVFPLLLRRRRSSDFFLFIHLIIIRIMSSSQRQLASIYPLNHPTIHPSICTSLFASSFSGKSRIQWELSVCIHLTCHVHCCSTARHFLLCSFTYSQILNQPAFVFMTGQDKSFLFPPSFCLSRPKWLSLRESRW